MTARSRASGEQCPPKRGDHESSRGRADGAEMTSYAREWRCPHPRVGAACRAELGSPGCGFLPRTRSGPSGGTGTVPSPNSWFVCMGRFFALDLLVVGGLMWWCPVWQDDAARFARRSAAAAIARVQLGEARRVHVLVRRRDRGRAVFVSGGSSLKTVLTRGWFALAALAERRGWSSPRRTSPLWRIYICPLVRGYGRARSSRACASSPVRVLAP